MTQAPALIRLSGPFASRLLDAGMPMGPNTLLTVRGRVSGKPRTTPVAVLEADGRRWIVGTFGDVHWVRNLRAAGEGVIRVDGRPVEVAAVELPGDEATAFFRDAVPAYIMRLPLPWRVLTRVLIRIASPDVFSDQARAATRRPVFELLARPASRTLPGGERRSGG